MPRMAAFRFRCNAQTRRRTVKCLRYDPRFSLSISNAIDYAKFRSRSDDAVIRAYDAAGNVIETHEHKGAMAGLISGSAFSRNVCTVPSIP